MRKGKEAFDSVFGSPYTAVPLIIECNDELSMQLLAPIMTC